MWIEEKKLHEGAEAIVTSGYWLGKPAIKKFRRPRKWRHPELDSRLTKSRLTSEVRTLLKSPNQVICLFSIFPNFSVIVKISDKT